MSRKLALDIGAGSRPVSIEGYDVQTLDIRPEVKPTYIGNIDKIPVPDATFDLLFASHLIEHVKRGQIHQVMKEWRRILRDGGTLQLIVPDLEIACMEILSTMTTSDTWDIVYGAQDHDYNVHYCGFTWQSLEALIKRYGYKVNKLEMKERQIFMTCTKEGGWVE